MSIPSYLPGSTERHFMEHREVVVDDGGFADDHARGVVEEDSFADAGPRMDVHGEDLGDAALQKQGQGLAVVDPIIVRGTVGLEGMKALEVQQGDAIPAAAGSRVITACRSARIAIPISGSNPNAVSIRSRIVREVTVEQPSLLARM